MSKPKVLVLGATGMLGHQVFQYLNNGSEYEVVGTCREPDTRIQKRMYGRTHAVLDVLLGHEDQLRDLFTEHGPFEYIINCIGAIKPTINEGNPASVADAIRLNSIFPHELAVMAGEFGGKIFHPSTDCVFSGDKRMPYKESDLPDATDVYGRSKVLGECPQAMNIRTSIVGPEMNTQRSLLEWYLDQDGEVNGFVNHHWNGMTTYQWAKVVYTIMKMGWWKPGIQHMPSLPVSKENLLWAFKKEFARVGRVCADIKPVKAPQEKWMTLKTEYPVYMMQLTVPHIIDQVRELVQKRYTS